MHGWDGMLNVNSVIKWLRIHKIWQDELHEQCLEKKLLYQLGFALGWMSVCKQSLFLSGHLFQL